MIKQWELFEKVSTGRTARHIRVSLNERGGFALNQKAFDDLKQPKAVQLYFDRVNSLIGVKACDPEEKTAYAVKQVGNSKSFLIRAMAFCTHYNIQVKGTVVFKEPIIEDGMLELNLRTTSQVASRPTKKHAADDQDSGDGTLKFAPPIAAVK